MTPRLLSFDVWNTLLVANPEFKAARQRYLSAELGLSPEVIEPVYRRHKDGADREAEVSGAGASCETVYRRFLADLDRDPDNWAGVLRGMEITFGRNPPVVLPETVGLLRYLQLKGFGLSIASNTNFIPGSCLHDVALGTWGVAWDFEVFSNELEHSKPHPNFWNVVAAEAEARLQIKPEAILHIGDHLICDGGCTAHGIGFEHVHDPAGVPAVLRRFVS